ncbi:exported hypothetical protein [Desulfamplus magnetovallimortis]|uniref:POTRA domain-containing protein n=1 Tax=Desulfamplus magnetovallimortis TaxID=1246637 RepID=A0A1W1H4T0_9BACT|nr:POTRA domain-containing protein [Desulfamplus magnetovallimortis]SLM27454.1 exported hypothetical protein [Desulfamplus magnetovallimortis]
MLRYILIVPFFLFFSCFSAYAGEKPRIGIFPFEIYAPSSMDYLRQSIPVMIRDHLELDGAEIVLLDYENLVKSDVISEADMESEVESDIVDKSKSEVKVEVKSKSEAKVEAKSKSDVENEKFELGNIDYKSFQNLGLEKGLDYVLWGSLFTAGGDISIDIRLLNVLSFQEPVSFFGRAKAIENLFAAVTTICKEVGSEIFNRQMIGSVIVKGNVRIESDAVLRAVDVKPGDAFNPMAISRDLKKIFEMGYFEDVRVESEKKEKGIELVFLLWKNPA